MCGRQSGAQRNVVHLFHVAEPILAGDAPHRTLPVFGPVHKEVRKE